jgi:hypothetical protein
MRYANPLKTLTLGLSLFAFTACNDPTGSSNPNVTLTDAQAASLVAKAQVLSGVNPDLAWLADSISVVLKAGTTAYNVPVTVNGQVKRYYAVSLVRQIIGVSASTTTMHFIAFNSATDPTDFILVNAYVQVPGDVPIGDFATPLGAPAAFAHRVLVSGSTVTDYVGKSGTVDFSVGYSGVGCGVGPGVTCTQAFLDTDFTITQARPDAKPNDVHTFSASDLTIPGVLLLFS